MNGVVAASSSLDACEIEFRSLMEALGIGPRVVLMMDAYSAGSLEFVTEVCRDWKILTYQVTSDIPGVRENQLSFLEAVIYRSVLGLNKSHLGQNESGEIQIVHFKVPDITDGDMKIPEDANEFRYWFSSPKNQFWGWRFTTTELSNAFEKVKRRLKSLPLRLPRFFVYPPQRVCDSVPLVKLLLEKEGEGECECGSDSFENYLDLSLKHICNFFFAEKLCEPEILKDRCMGSLFGLTGTEEEFSRLSDPSSANLADVPFYDIPPNKIKYRDRTIIPETRKWIQGIDRSATGAVSRLQALNKWLKSRVNRFVPLMEKMKEDTNYR
jgi:hypothetical protein